MDQEFSAADDAFPAEAAPAACAVHADPAGRLGDQPVILSHGGMGVTDPVAVGHCFKRVAMNEAMPGKADRHLGAYAALPAA